MRLGIELDADQMRVVEHSDGPLVVCSGPGSGKTRVISERTKRLLAAGVDPDRVLVVTFTRRAAREMRSRLRDVHELHRMRIGTFHSLCLDLIRRRDPVSRVIDRHEQTILTCEILKDIAIKAKATDVVLDISYAKSRMISPESALLAARSEFERSLCAVYKLYQSKLNDLCLLDFDDIIWQAVRLLDDPKERRCIESLYDYVMVDEYQDTDPAQLEVLRALAVGGNIVAVGDEDQAIYGFRGADPSLMSAFCNYFKGADVHRLSMNYRSNPEIVRAAFRVISNNRPTLTARRVTPVAGLPSYPVEVLVHGTQDEQYAYVAGMAAELQAKGSVGVLCRVRSGAIRVSGVLNDLGIGHTLVLNTAYVPTPDLNADTDGIMTCTIHAAKGLEFDSVILIDACEGIIPHIRSMEQDGGIQEERRLFYVGMTRAKTDLFLSYARMSSRGREMSPSRFIAEAGGM